MTSQRTDKVKKKMKNKLPSISGGNLSETIGVGSNL